MPLESDEAIRDLLRQARTIAVLGIKDDPGQDAHRVPAYMQSRGLRILPVNPKLESTLGEPAVACLGDLTETLDMLNVFRAPQHLPMHLPEILALDPLPRCVWLQLGIRDDDFARRLEEHGIAVVQDRCLMVEYRRLAPQATTA
jgi:predicted CoA-binding protein